MEPKIKSGLVQKSQRIVALCECGVTLSLIFPTNEMLMSRRMTK